MYRRGASRRLYELQFLRLHVNTQVTRHDSFSRVMIKAQVGEGHAYQVGVNMGGKTSDRPMTDTRSIRLDTLLPIGMI